jgi:alkanesulfonate monooxygenase SsuD/methylene tetrahydromethanopterin reductase-like flavin-dependent oxidoreductase (luciferase family)
MKFHWIIKGQYSIEELTESFDSLGDNRYESVLIPFQPTKHEPIVVTMFLAHKYPNIRYMIAIRPYTISFGHLAMITKTFNIFFKNRPIINFVSGQFESEYEYFVGETSTNEERKEFLYNYVKLFVEKANAKEYTDIAISGTSEQSLKTISDFADYGISLLCNIDKTHLFDKNKKNMVRAFIALDFDPVNNIGERDTMNVFTAREKENSLCGSEESIINQIAELEKRGVTDLLISTTYQDYKNFNKIHALVDKYQSK